MKPHNVVTIEDLISGKVTPTDTKHQYCIDHEGEKNKFYCKTCKKLVCRDCILMVQHCRDHQYVTVKDAAKEKLITIEEEMKKCDGKKKECQDALDKISSVMSGLDKAADDARKINRRVKTMYLQQLEEFFDGKEQAIDSMQHTRKVELRSAEKDIQGRLKQLDRAGEQGKVLKDSTSHYDIVTKCNAVVDTLKALSKINVTKIDDRLVDIPVMSIPPVIDFSQRWKLIGQFSVPCKESDEGPTGIAVASDGKIALCDRWQRVLVMSKSGDHNQLTQTIGVGSLLGGRGDVSVTSTNAYVIPKHFNCCQLYDSKCKLLSEFKTYRP